METQTAETAPSGDISGASMSVEKRVRNALSVADYAIEAGFVTSDGEGVDGAIIATIETTAAKLGFFSGAGLQKIGGATGVISAAEWVEFELAYYKLASLVRPITAETLRDTEPYEGVLNPQPSRWEWFKSKILGSSPANRFTRGLWLVAIVFVLFVVSSDWFIQYAAQDGDNNSWRAQLTQFLQILVPYAYGGLGACAYLLRSAHTFVYRRTFDVRRQPEYFNRILLGSISGGAIIVLVNKTAGDDDTAIQLGSAALGFIAGYTTDFLFNKIQKIIAVLLPKDDDDGDAGNAAPAKKAAQPDPKDLADRHDKAQSPEDKDFYKDMMRHAVGAPAAGGPRRRPNEGRKQPGKDAQKVP